MMPRARKLAVVAIGGNALIIDAHRKSIPEQYEAAAAAMRGVVDLVEAGWEVVLTHGNGPQVGFIMRRSELAAQEVPTVPMDYAGADLQGALGYMFVRSLRNELRRRGITRRPVAIVTQTLVDRDDPAFANPTKPIGAHMAHDVAVNWANSWGWAISEDAGRGWRRVVPSPRPQAIVEIDEIRELVNAGHVVVACGGGGIPVIEDQAGDLLGVEAVIDKDLASSLLARELEADMLVISTAVDRVAIGFNTPQQRWLDQMSLGEAKTYLAAEEFDAGSMGPKVKAIADFVESTGKTGLITSPGALGRAIAGETGTRVVQT